MKAVVVVACLTLLVCYFLHEDLPENYSTPWGLRANSIPAKFFIDLGWLAERLGVSTMHDVVNAAFVADAKPDPRIEPLVLDGVSVRVYNSEGSGGTRRPAFVYYHGGGWILLRAASYDSLMLAIAAAHPDLVIFNVDYQLADGKIKFPEPFDDCVKATRHIINNADTFGVDPERVAVGGESAGGNLAAAVSLKLRDDDFRPMPKLQLLLYPALQAMDFSLPSMEQNPYMPIQKRYYMAWFWSVYATGMSKYVPAMLANMHTTPEVKKAMARTYIRHEDLDKGLQYAPYRKPPTNDFGDPEIWKELEKVFMNPYFAPLMADDVSRLPEAFMYTSRADVLRDEGLLYARRLEKAAIPVTYGQCAFHAVCLFALDHAEGKQCVQDVVTFLKNKL